MGDLKLHLMSSRAAVAGFKKCSRVHIDKSVYDFVHHVDSDVRRCATNAEALEVQLKS